MTIDDLYAKAAFDDDDRDMGTSGLCATFALALYERLTALGMQASFVIACVGDASLKPSDLHWRHALVEHAGKFYDVDGEVLGEHVLDNYCWGTLSPHRTLMPLSKQDFLLLIDSTPNAYDENYYRIWGNKLKAASNAINIEFA